MSVLMMMGSLFMSRESSLMGWSPSPSSRSTSRCRRHGASFAWLPRCVPTSSTHPHPSNLIHTFCSNLISLSLSTCIHSQIHIPMEILSRLQKEQPCLRTTTEAVVAFVHCHLLGENFRNDLESAPATASTNDTGAVTTTSTTAAFPAGWNASPDSYSFRYRHAALPDDTLVLKVG